MCGGHSGGRSASEVATLATCHGCFNNQGLDFLSLNLLYSKGALGPPAGRWFEFLVTDNTEILLYTVLLIERLALELDMASPTLNSRMFV